MPWDFETDPQFQEELDWIDDFVTHHVEPIDQVLEHPYDIEHEGFKKLVRPLQQTVKDRKLWACHLGPNLGGPGYGQLVGSVTLGIADGPTEVHKITVARETLREYEAYEGLFPPLHYLDKREKAIEKLGSLIEHEVGVAPGAGWL